MPLKSRSFRPAGYQTPAPSMQRCENMAPGQFSRGVHAGPMHQKPRVSKHHSSADPKPRLLPDSGCAPALVAMAGHMTPNASVAPRSILQSTMCGHIMPDQCTLGISALHRIWETVVQARTAASANAIGTAGAHTHSHEVDLPVKVHRLRIHAMVSVLRHKDAQRHRHEHRPRPCRMKHRVMEKALHRATPGAARRGQTWA